MCDWTNVTDKSMAAWRLATVTRRPANLVDKTFGAPGHEISETSDGKKTRFQNFIEKHF